MTIYLRGADDAQALRDRIVKTVRIDKNIETWGVDADGMLLHTPSNWPERGRFVVTVDNDGDVKFAIKNWNGDAYHYLHGRLVELLLGHFQGEYSTLLIQDTRTK